MTQQDDITQRMLTDDEIEALAKKHICPHHDRLEAVLPNRSPYQKTEQFRRVKALVGDVLSKLRAEGVPYCYALETRGPHGDAGDVLLDIEYNRTDNFSGGRTGGKPLFEHPAPVASAPADERALTAQQRKEFIRRTSYISEADRDTRAAFVDEIVRAALSSAPVAGEAQKPVVTLDVIYPGCIEYTLTEAAQSLPVGKHACYAAPQASEAVRVHQLEAARIAYASEFPPDEHGDPDVSSIHANIRKLKAQYSAARNAALEEAADFSAQYIRKFGPGGVATAIRALKQPQADKDGGQQSEGVVTDDMRYAVRFAPSSAHWSERLMEFFGPDAREGIDALEKQLREARAALSATQTEQGERDE